MKKIVFILIAFFLCLLDSNAQIDSDTASVVKIIEVIRVDANTLQFQLNMQRVSDSWSRWANATYSITFNDTSFHYDKNNIKFEYVGATSEIPFEINRPAPLPVNKYTVLTQVDPDRLIIYYLGPEEFSNAIPIPKDSALNIGTFKITRTDGEPLPLQVPGDTTGFRVIWSTPLWRLQAIAYKTDQNLTDNGEVMFVPDDNKDFLNPLGLQGKFLNEPTPKPAMRLVYFSARYVGGFNVKLDWELSSQFQNEGFLITRATLPYGKKDYSNVSFNDTVAYYKRNNPLTQANDSKMFGVNGPGYTIYTLRDTAQRRALNYVYKLSYYDFIVQDFIDLAHRVMLVPNATIESAAAWPNPFERRTQIEYTVKDNVTLTIKLYDLNGKELMTVMENERKNIGTYIFDLNMPEFATQGLYDMRFFALPIDDPTVETSNASLRLQMTR